MKKCGKGSPAFPYSKEVKSVKINNNEQKNNKPMASGQLAS